MPAQPMFHPPRGDKVHQRVPAGHLIHHHVCHTDFARRWASLPAPAGLASSAARSADRAPARRQRARPFITSMISASSAASRRAPAEMAPLRTLSNGWGR